MYKRQGTGAGIFLDTVYDLRRLCESITGRRPRIIGHIVMPETFDVSPQVGEHFGALAFALLTQIQHYMDAKDATLHYLDGRSATWPKEESPFDFCFLLGGVNKTGGWRIARESWPACIGEMIALLAAGKAGERLLNQSINVVARQYSQGVGQKDLKVFSSYGLRTASRPGQDGKEAFRQAFLYSVAQMSEPPPAANNDAELQSVAEAARKKIKSIFDRTWEEEKRKADPYPAFDAKTKETSSESLGSHKPYAEELGKEFRANCRACIQTAVCLAKAPPPPVSGEVVLQAAL